MPRRGGIFLERTQLHEDVRLLSIALEAGAGLGMAMDPQSREAIIMKTHGILGLFLVGLILVPASALLAQSGDGETAAKADTDKATGSEDADSAPKRKPKYLNLRYDEDFSYLDGPADSYESDFFDPIKNIHLGPDWRLSLGGEFRYQMDHETNKNFGAADPTSDTFHLFRYMLHADFKYRDLFRVFVQGVSAFDEGRDLARRGIDENRWDIQQLFFDLKILGEDKPLTLRVGRQDLQYGNQRLVSPLDWANVRRRFDGVKLFAKGETWDIDLWWVRPVVVQRKQHDRDNEDIDFYGAYVTYKGIPRHGLDVYFFALIDSGNPMNPNGRAGDRNIYTLGARFWGKTAGFDYETELAGQWGHWAGDTVQAWSWTIDGGYNLADLACKPRLGVGFDWTTGDKNPTDSSVGTFDQLFPLGHKYLGFLDLVGRKNITALNINLSAWVVPEKVKAYMAYHAFWLSENKDALYSAGGGALRRDPTGRSGTEVGQELDLTVAWKLNAHSKVLFGYSHLWDSDVIIQTGPSEDADLFYIQYAYKF